MRWREGFKIQMSSFVATWLSLSAFLAAVGGPLAVALKRWISPPFCAELVGALKDTDSTVRAWAAQDIGNIGASAVTAVPYLLALLEGGDEAARNSACIALRKIGPPAVAALPALQRALSDPSADVREFAALAIESIKGEQW